MPVLLLVLGAIILAFVLVRGFRERDGRSLPRRAGVTERLTDPREAAAILLVQQAVYEGHVTPAHKEVIVSLMKTNFGAAPDEAEGFYSFGRMAVGQTGDAANSLRRLLAPIRDRCTLSEMKDLAAMLVQVGETGGSMNGAQERLVQEVSRALSLPASDQASR